MQKPANSAEWIELFSDCSEADFNKALVRFSGDYWHGRLSDNQLFDMLGSENLTVRQVAAWAAADREPMRLSVAQLMHIAKSETDPKIKSYAIAFACNCRMLSKAKKLKYLKHFLSDSDANVRDLTALAMDEVTKPGNGYPEHGFWTNFRVYPGTLCDPPRHPDTKPQSE